MVLESGWWLGVLTPSVDLYYVYTMVILELSARHSFVKLLNPSCSMIYFCMVFDRALIYKNCTEMTRSVIELLMQLKKTKTKC